MRSDRQYYRNNSKIVYNLVVVLIIIQVSSFGILIMNFGHMNDQVQKLKENITDTSQNNQLNYINRLASTNQTQYTADEIRGILQVQKQLINENDRLKSNNGDFSSIIQEVLKGVVSIETNKAEGTGFFVADSGYIVTNEHVVSGSKQVKIFTSDGKNYDAQIIGQDDENDIALLKIDANYTSLKFADSDKVVVGENVIAIGNPYGLSFSASKGIVSAVNREGINGESDYIQTDVALNPGNSGGPLIDSNGKVIGITNFKVGGAEDLGFALNINSVRDVVNKIAKQTLVS